MAEDTTNEIVAAAKDAKARTEKAIAKVKPKDGWPLKAIGLGVGIGSAAVAAAMLYANRDKKDD
ncbi:hypothetical protein [uncultured Sphingomonas sp.]|uniref:hypothetical protein n=1 Tax=uncultured Sphingomonas sp. TaxID=158754 RepID=UPI0025CD1039|nr:hypothetical protein [uncultured Sphingomonas sp.]